MSSTLTEAILFAFVQTVKLGAKIRSTPFDWNAEREEVTLRPGWNQNLAFWKVLCFLSFLYTTSVIWTLLYWTWAELGWWQVFYGGSMIALYTVLPMLQKQVLTKTEKLVKLLNLVRGLVKTYGPNLDPFHRSQGEGFGPNSRFTGWVLLGFVLCLPLLSFGSRLEAIYSNSRVDTVRPAIGYLLQAIFGDSNTVGFAQVALAMLFDIWFTVYYLSFAMLFMMSQSVLAILGVAAYR